jgi:Mrp family chromosome partitioning ATPase/capsular polysaccharide biosynthesis protein
VTLGSLLSALRSHRLAAASAAFYVLLVAIGAAQLPKDDYSATVTLMAQPATAADTTQVFSAFQYIMPQLATTAESKRVEGLVDQALTPALRDASVTITAAGDPSGILKITAESHTRDAVEEYANQTGAALRAVQAESATAITVTVLDPAIAPEGPSGPPRTAILLAGAVLAVFAAVFTALGMAALRRRDRLGEELSRRLGVPVLAELPRLRGAKAKALDAGPLHGDVDPRVVEAVQRLRNGIEVGSRESRGAVAVTSVHPGEGKSTVAALLAWSLGSAGYRVLLVDSDLRLPSQHVRFDVPLVPGLADLQHALPERPYAGVQPDVVLAAATSVPTLRVLAAGASDRHPADVLEAVLPPLLRADNGEVVLDTPPLDSVAESLRVTVAARRVVLVVDSRSVRQEELERQVARLRDAGVLVLGIVLNRIAPRRITGGYDPYARALRPARSSARGRRSAPPVEIAPPVATDSSGLLRTPR